MSSDQTISALELQIAEVEMLASMYPNAGEFVSDDLVTLDLIRSVVSGEMDVTALESRIGFTVTVTCSDKGKDLKVELACQLPHDYPFVKPQIFIRAPDMNRERHKCLREDLNQELENQEEGDIIVGVLVEWLKERLYEEVAFLVKQNSGKQKNADKKAGQVGRDSLTRLWIYSHHIYSKIKRKDIQDWGTELQLHGFSMPGKPGVICAEGFTADVDEFWYRIRRMTWKKICIKEQEVIPLMKTTDAKNLYKFDPFFELVLDARGGKGREYHMDLGQFNSYLQQHDSSSIFPLFFGVDGKTEDDT